MLRVKDPTWGPMIAQCPGSPALSPSVLYPCSDPVHSFWSLVPVKMLSLLRSEHAFCCRKMKAMQPSVFLFRPLLPEARAKRVAQVLGALVSQAPLWLPPGGAVQAHLPVSAPLATSRPSPKGKGANQEETRGLAKPTWGNTEASNRFRCLPRLCPSDLRRDKMGERNWFRQS